MLVVVVRAALVLFIGFFASITVAQAQPLDAQRQSGAIGERYDGYVVAREASAEPMAGSVNAERARLYQRRAAKQGVSVEEVGRVYAKKIFEQAPTGTWFLTEKGSWIRK